MKFKTENQKKIEEIMSQFKCSKDYKCYKLGLKKLCKAKDIGVDSLLECLEKNPLKCQFATSYGYSYLCQCPLRVYIAKNLRK